MRKSALFLLLLIFLFWSCKKKDDPPPVNPTTEVPVGLVLSLTGSFGPYGNIQQNGALLAISEINSGLYIPNVRLKAWFQDDKSNPDTCRKVFRSLINENKVMCIIGPTSSNSAFQADTIAQNNQVIVLGISNTVPGITEMGNYIFRNSLPESGVIPNTVSVTHAKLGYSRIAIIYGNDDAYTIGAYEIFKTALESTAGISIVQTETVKKGDTLFTDQLTRVKASNPDAIIITALVNEASKLMIQARQMDIPDTVRFIGGNNFNTSRLAQLAGSAAEGAICGAAWIESEDTPGNAAFVLHYQQLFGTTPDQFAAQAYTGIYLIANAISRASSITPEGLRKALAQTSQYPTILGDFSFDQNRDPVHPPVVQVLSGGKFELFQ